MPEDEDMILPDDFVETPAEESAQPQAEQVTKEEVETAEDTKPSVTPTDVVAEPQRVKIKYNHQEEEITLDEALVLAQKGKNYDKLQEQLNTMKSNPTLSFLDGQAKRLNMTTEQYIESWRANEEQAEIIELTKQNVPEEYAKEIVANRRKEQPQQTEQQVDNAGEAEDQQMIDFVEAFPGVDGATIKPETWAKVKAGTPLKYAYMEQERAELLVKAKVVEQNETNKNRALVKSVTAHGSIETAEKDDFLEGFDSIQ